MDADCSYSYHLCWYSISLMDERAVFRLGSIMLWVWFYWLKCLCSDGVSGCGYWQLKFHLCCYLSTLKNIRLSIHNAWFVFRESCVALALLFILGLNANASVGQLESSNLIRMRNSALGKSAPLLSPSMVGYSMSHANIRNALLCQRRFLVVVKQI